MADTKTVRLRNTTTGVIVEVREDKAELLGLGWDAEKSSTRKTSTTK
jgi:hypothetical protein